jgi:hypothetical protein
MNYEIKIGAVLRSKRGYVTKSTPAREEHFVRVGDLAIVISEPYIDKHSDDAIDLLHAGSVIKWTRASKKDLLSSILNSYEIVEC